LSKQWVIRSPYIKGKNIQWTNRKKISIDKNFKKNTTQKTKDRATRSNKKLGENLNAVDGLVITFWSFPHA
jgi:hypothetical protein